MISVRKSGNVYQYCFEAGKVNGKRNQITKSGFKTKNEAYMLGQKAYDEFINGVSDVEYKIIKSNSKRDRAEMVFTRKDGTYSGTDIIRYPFRIIHHELGI